MERSDSVGEENEISCGLYVVGDAAPLADAIGVGIWVGGWGNARYKSDSTVVLPVGQEEARSVETERRRDAFEKFLNPKKEDLVQEIGGAEGGVIELSPALLASKEAPLWSVTLSYRPTGSSS